jgi:hypothetical protein
VVGGVCAGERTEHSAAALTRHYGSTTATAQGVQESLWARGG